MEVVCLALTDEGEPRRLGTSCIAIPLLYESQWRMGAAKQSGLVPRVTFRVNLRTTKAQRYPREGPFDEFWDDVGSDISLGDIRFLPTRSEFAILSGIFQFLVQCTKMLFPKGGYVYAF